MSRNVNLNIITRGNGAIRTPGGFVRISTLDYGDDDPVDVDPSTTLMMDYGPGEGPLLGHIINRGTIIYDPSKAVEVRARSFTNMVTGFHDITADGVARPWSKPISWIWGRPGDMPANLPRGLNFTGNVRRYNSDTDDMAGQIRGYRNMGGRERMIAETPADVHISLGDHIQAGATSITLSKGVYWKAGMVFAVPSTGYAKSNQPVEYRTLNADTNGSAVLTFDQPLTYFRWGKLQYITDTGMSLTPGTFTYAADATKTFTNGLTTHNALATYDGQPSLIDLRGWVALISMSSCMMTCVNDTNWQNDGYGFHIMQMGPAGLMNSQWEGIWFQRFGQRGRHARYGFHFHNLSWAGLSTTSPTYRGPVHSQSYFRKLGFMNGENRCFTVHGTDGSLIEKCSLFGGVGSGLFHEDFTERKNVARYNIIGDIKVPLPGMALKSFDQNRRDSNNNLVDGGNDQFMGPQGMWTPNLDNVFLGNRVYNCVIGWQIPVSAGVDSRQGYGYGDAHNIYLQTQALQAGTHDNNVVQSCLQARLMNTIIRNEQGDDFLVGYKYTTIASNGQTTPTIFGPFSMFYNLLGYGNGADRPTYNDWTVVGWKERYYPNGGRYGGSGFAFSGVTNYFTTDSGIRRPRIIGHCLYDDDNYRGLQVPFASYHNTINFPYALIMNVGRFGPFTLGNDFGQIIYFGTTVAPTDLYLSGIHKGMPASPGWRLFNTRFMDRTPPAYPMFFANPPSSDTFYGSVSPALLNAIQNNRAGYNRSFAGPFLDPDGNAGFGTNNTILLNHPHWTYGLSTQADPNNPSQVHTQTRFVGINVGDFGYGNGVNSAGTDNTRTQKWSRIDPSTNAVIPATVIDYGATDPNLAQIGRFFIDAVPENGWIKLEMGGAQPVSYTRFDLVDFKTDFAPVMVTFPWNGPGNSGTQVTQACIQYPYAPNLGGPLAKVNNLTDLKSASVSSFYIDTSAQLIHMKFFTSMSLTDRNIVSQETIFHEITISTI